ncbi:MAG: hypothetical protein ACD_11C00103G0030 [uncultured bacterium]|nr:MAG: hypothetical protein ACD_11C00103G0030 [uncultured bacterium]HBR71472.1 hypothetical protein [Candidatus Moranbacteria bacterium]
MGTTKEVLEKLRGIDGPKLLAIVDGFGGREMLDAWLRGELKMTLEEIIKKLIDKNGRLIPARELIENVCDPNKNFSLTQPRIDYKERLARIIKFFPKGMKFSSLEQFIGQSESLFEQMRSDLLLSNLLNGIWLPTCFPQMEIRDYGKTLEEVFILAAKESYRKEFPKRSFNNYRKGELAGKVEIIVGSRHEKLFAKIAEGPVVGIQFFPTQGFSIDASRQQMSVLPESLLLSGGIDIMTAVAMYPDVLGKDFNTPGYLCAANSWRSAEYSLYAGAHDGDFGFGDSDDLFGADARFSSGLLFIG